MATHPYISQADVTVRVGGAQLMTELTDDNNDSVADAVVVTLLLDGAADLAEAAVLRAGGGVPLADVDFNFLNTAMLDVANYKAKARRGKASADDRQQYEDALALFEKIANGDVTLPSSGTATDPAGADVAFDGYDQQCNRDRLAGY